MCMTKVEFRWDQGEKRVMIPSKTYLYLQVYELLILPETIDHNARSYSFILLSWCRRRSTEASRSPSATGVSEHWPFQEFQNVPMKVVLLTPLDTFNYLASFPYIAGSLFQVLSLDIMRSTKRSLKACPAIVFTLSKLWKYRKAVILLSTALDQ